MTSFADLNSFHWKQVYAGLVGQTVGYGASAAYQVATGSNPVEVVKAHVLPFLLSAASEVATAPLVFATEQTAEPATGFISVLSTAATAPLIFQLQKSNRVLSSSLSALKAEPSLSVANLDPRNLRLSIPTKPLSTVISNAPLAGVVGSVAAKISTASDSTSRISVAEGLFGALTRAAVVANALLSSGTLPKALAAATVGMDLLAVSTGNPILHTSSSLASAVYLGSLADPSSRTALTYILGLSGTALHVISNSE
jgi:hypothetical protein